MTFRPTPFSPYDTSRWTASPEVADVSYDVARERAPQAGVPLRKPYQDQCRHGILPVEDCAVCWDEDPIEDHALPGYDETDVDK